MQWIEIVGSRVRASRERGDTDPTQLAGEIRNSLGERSLPPELTRILNRAADGKYSSIANLWRALDEVCKQRSSHAALWAVIGVAAATLFGFLVAYGC